VHLQFAPRPGEAISRTVVVELMGRHSNLFLLDEERRVVAAARQVREQQSRLRPIATGDAYSPPPPLAGKPPCRDESFAHWRQELQLLPLPLKQALQGAYQGISPALALQLAGDRQPEASALLKQPVDTLTQEQWQQLWQRWQSWLTALGEGRFQISAGEATAYRCWPASDSTGDPLAINQALADYHQQQLGQRRQGQRRRQLEQRLQQALSREQQQQQHQQALLDQVENSETLQRQADALLCLQQPSREQVAEAQALYKKARKLRRSVAAITPRLEQHHQRITELEASLTYLEQLPPTASLEELTALEQDSDLVLKQRSKGTGSRQDVPCPLEARSPNGARLQVGRNHRQNEWISLRQARRGDLWFHAQECPGSHVVLKGSEAPLGEADLQAAADLAAHFSRARGNNRVAVVMVPTEDLQRIPGAAAGTVRHRGGTVLWAEPARAAALLERAVPSLNREPEP
jgi:predicted ribosome quality control (RQC) complex YloA/Tae2 family protein